MIKCNAVTLALLGLVISSGVQAGVPRLTVGIGFLMAGFVTGNQAWEAYKNSRHGLHKAMEELRELTRTAPQPKPVPNIHEKVDPYMKNPAAVAVYNYYLNHPQACQYGAASALCLGIGAHLIHQEFKGKKHHHRRRDD